MKDESLKPDNIIDSRTTSHGEAPKILDPQITEIWNVFAHSYDQISTYSCAHVTKIQHLAELIMGLPVKSLLDLGCGSGVLEKSLLDHGFNGQIVAIDSSNEMLRIARDKVGQYPDVDFKLFDLNQKLPFQHGLFDCVTAINVIFMLRQPSLFLSEIRRILRPGGRLLLVSPKPSGKILNFFQAHLSDQPLTATIKDLASSWFRIGHVIRTIAIQKKFDKFHKNNIIHYHSEEELKDLVISAGFCIEEFNEIQAGQNWLVKAERL